MGQGTIAVEMLEQQPNLDAIIVPVSGGGMLAGIAAAAKSIKPSIRVFAVEPLGKQLGRSLALRGQGWISPEARDALLDTIADAIRTKVGHRGCCEAGAYPHMKKSLEYGLLQAIGDVPWPLVLSHVDEHVFSVCRLRALV